MQVKREKAVYHTLNKLSVDVTRKVLVAEAWCPVSGKERVHDTLRSASHASAASVRPSLSPAPSLISALISACHVLCCALHSSLDINVGGARLGEADG